MEARVKKLEDDMTDIRVSLAEIKATLSHVATKADVETLRGEVKEVKGTLDGKLSAKEFLGYGFAMGSLAVGIMTLIIKWPAIAASLSVTAS